MITVVSVQSLLDNEMMMMTIFGSSIIVLMGGLGLLFDGITSLSIFDHISSFHHSHSHSHGGCDHDDDDENTMTQQTHTRIFFSKTQVHAAGDFLRSITLIVGGSIAWAGYEEDTHEIDSICSLIIVFLLLSASVVVAQQIYKGFYKEKKKTTQTKIFS